MNSNAPESRYCLDQLPDEALLAGTRSLVGRSNQVVAALLAHLAEVEARGIHRVRACASLYTYCIYELRMSEDAALRRARAAKIAREFPIVFEQLAAGEIHLTGLLMLGPHLSEFNHIEVLARAKHRSKKEIARLVRMLDPLPDVPSRVEPLGPASPGLVPRQNPTWDDVVASSCPVRELTPGERPKDWIESDSDGASDTGDVDVAGDSSVGGAPAVLPSPLAPERYKIQFTASQEYVELLEEAKALLAHAVPSRSLEEVHLRAMRTLVAELKKQKYGAAAKPRSDASDETGSEPSRADKRTAEPRWRGRTIPVAVRHAVWKRDGGRCTYVDASGQRCRETSCLEMHHEQAYARGGPPTESNITLRCRAHNALAAEEDFGRDFMQDKMGVSADGDPRQRGYACDAFASDWTARDPRRRGFARRAHEGRHGADTRHGGDPAFQGGNEGAIPREPDDDSA
jgi:hypothetical protein